MSSWKEAIKIPYQPSQTRRFEISHDPYSQERFTCLRSTYRELKTHVPFFAGMTVFGSLSKGKQLDEKNVDFSDVDVFTFVDVDALHASADQFAAENQDFRDTLHQVQGRSGRLSKDSVLNIAGHKYMEAVSRARLFFNSFSLSPQPNHSVMSQLIQVSGPFSIRGAVEAQISFTALNEIGIASDLTRDIAAPFCYDIGGGLQKYRQAFLRDLLSMQPELANALWILAKSAMTMYERGGDIPSSLAQYYPETIEEAAKYYGVSKK